MKRPRRICHRPGCFDYAGHGSSFCKTHDIDERKRRFARLETTKGSTKERGYGWRHQRLRAVVLARDPYCTRCMQAVSTVVDHIMPLAAGGQTTLDNLQGLCRRCNTKKSGRDRTLAAQRRETLS